MLSLLHGAGQGPPLMWYLVVILSLMAALSLGQVATNAGLKGPAPEYFNYQVADWRQKEKTPSHVSWRST